MKKKKTKLEEVQLTWHEWLDALKVPTPHKNKKKYNRNKKHRNNGED
jgi:hypothetical protein